MSPDVPSLHSSEPSSKEGVFNPQASLSRRAFLKAFLAFLGVFSVSRYFKRGSGSSSSVLVSPQVGPASHPLPDGRTIAYTAKPPPQKTNA